MTSWLILALFVIAFNSDISIGDDALLDDLFELLGNLQAHVEGVEIAFSVIVCGIDLVAYLKFSNAHLSLGKSSCFAHANVVEHGTSLN